MLYAVLVELEARFPISVSIPFVLTSSDSYPLPPPTTLVGALAYPYLRVKGQYSEYLDGFSPAKELLGKVVYASAGVASMYTVSRTVERVLQAPYLQPHNLRSVDMFYTVGTRMLVYTDALYAFYVVNDPDLVKCAYGIFRLGRKESLVSVSKVVAEPLDKVLSYETEACTRFYFPKKISDNLLGPYEEIDMPVLDESNYRGSTKPLTERFVVPPPFEEREVCVELNNEGAVVEIATERGAVGIPIPRRVKDGDAKWWGLE
ncbi:type I-A CRISPR-associated protein Cas5a [Thermofilum pendens]